MKARYLTMGPYTPGAWVWHPSNSKEGGFTIRAESGGFAPLAVVRGDKRSTLAAAQANACLIAAAPDMIEALYLLLSHCHHDETSEDAALAVRRARFAIEIAEGKVPCY